MGVDDSLSWERLDSAFANKRKERREKENHLLITITKDSLKSFTVRLNIHTYTLFFLGGGAHHNHSLTKSQRNLAATYLAATSDDLGMGVPVVTHSHMIKDI